VTRTHSFRLYLVALFGFFLIVSAAGAEAPEQLVISFGVQGGLPSTETLDGLTVRPADVIDLSVPEITFGELIDAEDVDAYHQRYDGSIIFSTTTTVFVDSQSFSAADLIEYDGESYSLFFDGDQFGASENVDAFSMGWGRSFLVSTATGAALFGFPFANGDVVLVDPDGQNASLFRDLDEAALFSGANQDIDGLHFDKPTGNLMISIRNDGTGSVAGVAYGLADDMFANVVSLDPDDPNSGSVALNGTGLFNGQTRQIDAVGDAGPLNVPALGPLAMSFLVVGMAAAGALRARSQAS